jgi:hypothetical protein
MGNEPSEVHGDDKLEARRVGDVRVGARNDRAPGLERLA